MTIKTILDVADRDSLTRIALTCPNCGAESIVMGEDENGAFYACEKCGYSTGYCESIEVARSLFFAHKGDMVSRAMASNTTDLLAVVSDSLSRLNQSADPEDFAQAKGAIRLAAERLEGDYKSIWNFALVVEEGTIKYYPSDSAIQISAPAKILSYSGDIDNISEVAYRPTRIAIFGDFHPKDD